jgi:hypothetical protein
MAEPTPVEESLARIADYFDALRRREERWERDSWVRDGARQMATYSTTSTKARHAPVSLGLFFWCLLCLNATIIILSRRIEALTGELAETRDELAELRRPKDDG